MCNELLECMPVFISLFILAELWILFLRVVRPAFHEYHLLLQQERDEDGTEDNEVQLCLVCGPVHPQGSRLGDLTTSSEAQAFLRVLNVMGLMFLSQFTKFLFNGSFYREEALWDRMLTCAGILATTGLVWELRNHEGVNYRRRDDFETGGPAALEADEAGGVAVPSPGLGSQSQTEIRNQSPEQHQTLQPKTSTLWNCISQKMTRL